MLRSYTNILTFTALKCSTYILLTVFFLFVNSCVSEFIPEIKEKQNMLVVDGLITDQPVTNRIILSETVPMGEKINFIPVKGAAINILDDIGNQWTLSEKSDGIYCTDSLTFRGIPGRKYSLIIRTYDDTYTSPLVDMKPVPPIDSLYFEKVLLKYDYFGYSVEGCNIYLDTHDPLNETRYFRWDFTETWEMRYPWAGLEVVENGQCWITEKSGKILIKSTSALSESDVKKYPLHNIGTEHDTRLFLRYSILVNQYSISADEYYYWDKLKRVYEETGSLYDLIPVNITGNIKSTSDPQKLVFGNFCVSSVSSGRIYIDEYFKGPNPYWDCIDLTITGPGPGIWQLSFAGSTVYTNRIDCIDCTYRGTKTKPEFWIDR